MGYPKKVDRIFWFGKGQLRLPLFYDKNLVLRYIDMVILNSQQSAQTLSFYGRKILGSARYAVRIVDQQTKAMVVVSITSVTIDNKKVTIDFDMPTTDQRWYAFDIYDNENTSDIVFKGVAFACNQRQALDKFSLYYDYNNTPPANDNTYLTL